MTNAYDLQWLVIYSDIIWANICTAHKKTNTRKWFSVSTAILHCVTFKWCSALLFTLHSERKHSWQTAADDLLGFLGKSSTVETVSRRYRWRPCPSRRRRISATPGVRSSSRRLMYESILLLRSVVVGRPGRSCRYYRLTGICCRRPRLTSPAERAGCSRLHSFKNYPLSNLGNRRLWV